MNPLQDGKMCVCYSIIINWLSMGNFRRTIELDRNCFTWLESITYDSQGIIQSHFLVIYIEYMHKSPLIWDWITSLLSNRAT